MLGRVDSYFGFFNIEWQYTDCLFRTLWLESNQEQSAVSDTYRESKKDKYDWYNILRNKIINWNISHDIK